MEKGGNTLCSEGHSNEIQRSANEATQNDKISQLRIILSQLVVLFPIALLEHRFGLSLGFTTVLIPVLSKTNCEFDVTLSQVTWFSTHCFVVPIAALFGGFLAQCVGVRLLFLLSYLLYITADFIFHWAGNIAMILVAQVIVGFTNGICKGPGFAYIAEIAPPKFRSVIMTTINLCLLFGIFLSTLLGNFLYWRTQVLVTLIYLTFGLAFFPFVPNSPHWLASKNRFEEAEKSLASVRGWTTPEAARDELYTSIISNINNVPNSLSSVDAVKEKDFKEQSKLKIVLLLYFNRSFYIPLLTVFCTFFFGTCNGVTLLTTYSVLIFEKIQSPIDGHVASVLISTAKIIGALVYIFTVNFLGKRILALLSIFITGICFTMAVIFLYLRDDKQQESQVHSWIVSVAFLTASIAHHAGLGKIMYFLNSELFPQRLRYVGSGIGYFINEILTAILAKIFLYVVLTINFPNTLVIFVIINVIGFITIYFILPETEGASLLEIESYFSASQDLKNKG